MKDRVSAIGMVCITTGALILAILGGTSCEFLKITSEPGTLLLQVDGVELEQDQANLGVYCQNDIFHQDGDQLWILSRVFFIVSATIGAIATAFAWVLATYIPPTKRGWRMLSVFSACAAIFAVPVFLLFEAKPCTEFKFQQACTFSSGSFIQITCVIAWTLGVAVTQFLDPPTWGEEPWKIGDEIVANPTESMKGDEEQGHGEMFAAARAMQSYNTANNETQYSKSVWDADPFAEVANEVYGSPTRTRANFLSRGLEKTDDDNVKGQNRVTVISSTEGESEIVATYPAYQEEALRPRSPFKPRDQPENRETPRPSPFQEATTSIMSVPNTSPPQFESNVFADRSAAEESGPFSSPQKKNKKRLSNLANKLKVDVRKPTFGRISTGRISTARIPTLRASTGSIAVGYSQMLGDDMSRSSRGSFLNSPSLQINVDGSVRSEESSVRSIRVKTKAEEEHEKKLLEDWNLLHAHLNNSHETDNYSPVQAEDKDIEPLADWNALHAATMSGARMGLQEGMSGAEDPYELASYHSDPEPVIYSSDEEEEDIIYMAPSQHHAVPTSIDRDDSSTISSHSSTSGTRKKSRSRQSRHRRRQRSDLVSLASASLLSQTIDEETVEDILEETSAEELMNTYAFARTISAPEPRSSGIDVRFSRLGRRPVPQDVASVRTANPAKVVDAAEKWKDPLDLGEATAADDTTAPRENATENRQYLRTSQSGSIDRVTSSARGSPIRQSPSAPSVLPLMTRRLNSRARSSGGGSSSISNSSTSMLSRRERARALRIQRLQNQSLNASNDQSDMDTSYMPKKYDSPAKTKGYPFKEEKKEDDMPFDKKTSNIVTPVSSSNSTFDFNHESMIGAKITDATFDEDEMNVDGSTSGLITPNYTLSNSCGSFRDETITATLAGAYQNTAAIMDSTFDDGCIMTDMVTNTVPHSPVMVQHPTFKEDDISIVTPHHDIEDSDPEDEYRHVDNVKAGAHAVREKILAGFSFSDDQQSHASISAASTDNSEAYGSSMMDELDLQLIEVRRPTGVEYGDEEMSL